MKKTFAELREEYLRHSLDEADAGSDPLELFTRWFAEATALELPLTNAMCLATVDDRGQPSARMVLLKDLDSSGFSFFTNYESRKGHELRDNPKAALLFWWPPLERQVRIEGTCQLMSAQESDEYFSSRPKESNLGAMASEQSRPLSSRAELEQRVQRLAQQWSTAQPPRPPNWGGYRLRPDSFEFWQGRANRLHDRLLMRRSDELGWSVTRLYP